MTTFAITQSCCSDASCVTVCPVNCIHPTPDEPDFGLTDMLYIDPRNCIGCGACADACPVDAIFPVEQLVGPEAAYVDLNRSHFGLGSPSGGDGDGDGDGDGGAPAALWGDPVFPTALASHAVGLRVAIVGTGPSASYTAAELLTVGACVTMIDRLPVPGGLIRFGVAPDHLGTKAIADRFATVFRNPRLEMVLNVEVGTHVSHDELLAHHDAVVYAVGASSERTLGVPGEDLPGSMSARELVGWYNAHPEVSADAGLLGEQTRGRAVIIGNGNVALDMARILLSDPAQLAETDIADHALEALRNSALHEVVLVARRGPEEAAYSLSELRPLLAREGLEVVVDGGPEVAATIAAAAVGSKAAALAGLPVVAVDWSSPLACRGRRLVLRFDSEVDKIDGVQRVEGVVLSGWAPGLVPTGLLLRAVGARSEPVAGLPFDEVSNTVPHEAGRVLDPVERRVVRATYVVGWIKRGPRGGIGSNRADAAQTVASIVADANARRLSRGTGTSRGFRRLVGSRRPEALGKRGYRSIDRAERVNGAAQGRPGRRSRRWRI